MSVFLWSLCHSCCSYACLCSICIFENLSFGLLNFESKDLLEKEKVYFEPALIYFILNMGLKQNLSSKYLEISVGRLKSQFRFKFCCLDPSLLHIFWNRRLDLFHFLLEKRGFLTGSLKKKIQFYIYLQKAGDLLVSIVQKKRNYFFFIY